VEGFLSLVMEPLREMLLKFRAFLPGFLAMLTIVVLGLFIAWLSKKILTKTLNALKFDSWCDRMGITALMRKGDLWAKPSEVTAAVIFWLLAAVSLMVGLNALNIQAIDNLVNKFFLYLPNVFSAVLILFVGYMVSGFLGRAVLIAVVNSGLGYAKLLSNSIRLLLSVLFLSMALEQLNVAPSIVISAFTIIFGGIVIALAVSFGVAGIETARKIIEGGKTEAEKHDKGDVEHL